MPLKVLLVGAESAAVQVLRSLAASDHEVAGVLVERAETLGASLTRAAGALGLPVSPADRVSDPAFAHWIGERGIDLLLNVHSLSIVHGDVAAKPRIGSFNLHPGPLPAYAGLNTVTWAIARGETCHAVTLHRMDSGIDTGRIAYAETFPINESDTGLTVFGACVRLGVALVDRLLDDAERDPGSIPALPQVGERTVYRRRDVPNEGRIEWTRTARQVHDLARSCDFGPFRSPCGHPRARLDGREIAVVGTRRTRAPSSVAPGTVGEPDDGDPTVATADEWLAISRVAVDGRRMAASEVLRVGQVLMDGPPEGE